MKIPGRVGPSVTGILEYWNTLSYIIEYEERQNISCSGPVVEALQNCLVSLKQVNVISHMYIFYIETFIQSDFM